MIGLRYAVLGSLAGDDPHPAFVVTQAGHGGLWLALASLPRAVSLMLVPQLPRPDYSPTDAMLAHPNFMLVACGVVLVAIGIAILALHFVRPTPWTFAGVFTVVALAPVSNLSLHTGVVVAERTLYSPSIGVALILGAGMVTLWKVVRGSSPSGSPRVVMARGAMVAAAGILIFMSLGYVRGSIPIWRDSTTAFAAIRERAPTSYRGYYLEADAERGRREVASAHHDYEQAIDRFSGDIALLHHAGLNALAAHDTAAALEMARPRPSDRFDAAHTSDRSRSDLPAPRRYTNGPDASSGRRAHRAGSAGLAPAAGVDHRAGPAGRGAG